MRVLVVEDEYLIAKRVVDELTQLGVETVGPANTVERALDLIANGGRIDAAVLDVRVRDTLVFPVADALRTRGVPFIFVTGFSSAGAIPERFSDVAHHVKPIQSQVLRDLVA